MSNFEAGKTYKLVDASKGAHGILSKLIASGTLTFPENKTFTCHNVDADGDCWSHTKGVTWNHTDSKNLQDVMCAAGADIAAFEEVVNG